MYQQQKFTTQLGQHELIATTGLLAPQAGGTVTLQMGDSMVLATATMSKTAREGLDFFPLAVEYEEKMYATGKIPGSYHRREGRPSTEATLIARLTDRPLRPLFPKNMRNEVQVIVTTLSYDGTNQLDILSVNAASIALMISDIPWDGPIGAVRVGYIDGHFVANPTVQQMEDSQLDLRIAGSREAIIMVEAGAKELPEALMIEALEFGHQALQPLIDLQLQMQAAIGKTKAEAITEKTDQSLVDAVTNLLGSKVGDVIREYEDRHERSEEMDEIRDDTVNSMLAEDENVDVAAVRNIIADQLKYAVRDRIIYEGVRPDGRKLTDIRSLYSQVGLSPRTHGSGLFQRGETQVLSILSLGTPGDAQKLEGLHPEASRRFMHHYNFPPFSTGETWPLRGPRRREIGHGALAQTALEAVIPSETEFPYAIRVVSEVLSSNGSTSQASVCATTLALMDGGVPIKRPIAGVAMGLITDGKKYAVLTDIQGVEDHLGDMDFKVAGSSVGITALQMDIKITGLPPQIMAEALEQARQARLQILDNMLQTLPAPRPQLSPFAPRMETIKIDPAKIGAVIGKGGATIRSLEENYQVSIDIQEDGTIFVAGMDGTKTEEALAYINALTKGVELGQLYTGKVVRIESFGAFVELLPGTDGMVHISQLASERLNRVEDAVQLGDEIMVMVTDIDSSSGKIRLSRRAVLEGWTLEESRERDMPGGGRPSGGSGSRPSGGNGGRDRDRGRDDRNKARRGK